MGAERLGKRQERHPQPGAQRLGGAADVNRPVGDGRGQRPELPGQQERVSVVLHQDQPMPLNHPGQRLPPLHGHDDSHGIAARRHEVHPAYPALPAERVQRLRLHAVLVPLHRHQLDVQEAGQPDEVGIGVGIHRDFVPRLEQGNQRDGQRVLRARRDQQVVRPRLHMEAAQPSLGRRQLVGISRRLAVLQQPGGLRPLQHRPRRLQDGGVHLIERLDHSQLDERLRRLLVKGQVLGAGVGGDEGAPPHHRVQQPLELADLVGPGDGAQVHVQKIRQLPLGRQPGVGGQRPRQDVLLQRPGDGLVKRRGQPGLVRLPRHGVIVKGIDRHPPSLLENCMHDNYTIDSIQLQ